MAGLKLPADFALKIRESLGLSVEGCEAFFDVEEDKSGYFVAKLKPKQFLDKAQFRMLCALARDLGGEGYLQGAKAWRVPGPYVKKDTGKPLGQGMDSERSYKEPGNAIPKESVTPRKDAASPFVFLPIEALLSMPFQSRLIREDSELLDLVVSVKIYGVLEPILVRPKENGLYEVVAGGRRVVAAKKAGLVEVPAIVKALNDQEAYEVQLIENVQRRDLSDMEKARMLDFMIKKFGYTQEALAQKLGKTQGWVSQHISMLKLEADYYPGNNVETVSPGTQTGVITERQAREILAASPEKREEIIGEINRTGEVPSARDLHEKVQPSVTCGYCGEPISDSPVHLKGKYFHEDCVSQAESESKSAAGQTWPEERETKEEEPSEPIPKKEPEPKPLLTGFEVECPECHKKLLINHIEYPGGKFDHEVELQ